MAEPEEHEAIETPEETPPLGRWSRMYFLVIGVLLVEILLFSVFTKVFE